MHDENRKDLNLKMKPVRPSALNISRASLKKHDKSLSHSKMHAMIPQRNTLNERHAHGRKLEKICASEPKHQQKKKKLCVEDASHPSQDKT